MHMKRKQLAVLMIIALFLLSSCGTCLNGTKGVVMFQSVPEGATVKVGNKTGTTPCSLKIPNKTKYFYIEKKGYIYENVPIKKRITAWAVADVFFYLIPLAVDYLTGGLWVLDERQIAYLRASGIEPEQGIGSDFTDYIE